MTVVDIINARIEKFESRQSKNGEYVSLTLSQEGSKSYASAFNGASIDGDAVVLPAIAGGEARLSQGDVVTLRARTGAYTNANGRAYPSFTVLGTVASA